MDPFALIMVGILLALVVWVLILGRWHPRSGAHVLLDQMLAATNERRRRRGEAELTEENVEARVREDQRLANEMRERYLADEDLRQMLDATNQRRTARGEPELSEAEFRAQLDLDRAKLEGG